MQKISSNTNQQTLTAEQTKHTSPKKESNEGTQADAIEDKMKEQANVKKQETQPYEKVASKTGIGGVFNTKG